MQANDADLLAGALALAYRYCGLEALREGFGAVDPAAGQDLPAALLSLGHLSTPRAEKLRRGAELARRLRHDAIYGMVALRNRLVGGAMLNACMEESRHSSYEKSLSQVLIERGVLDDKLHQGIETLCKEVGPDLFAKERSLAATVDLAQDGDDMAELKLGVLLGEVAAKVSFLNKDDFDLALQAREKIEQGVAPEVAMRQAAQQKAVASTVASAAAPSPLAPVAPEPAPAGSTSSSTEDAIKGYELLEKLGAGAMGAVLKARKRDTGEIVALKILKPQLAADREYVERFLREAKAVARLSHQHIIRAVQVGRSGEYYFFAMEFVQGRTASEMVKDTGPLEELLAIRIVRAVAAALQHAWQHQIVHRDIKPDNIMVTEDGDVKLTDLGLARTTKQDSTLTITGVVMGSPAYISPEQATGEKNLDIRSDIYSLGATLYHLLTGVVPYDGETPLHVMLKHMNDPLPDVRKVAPQVSEATRVLIMRMMAKKPEGRFQSASQGEGGARGIEDALAQGRAPQVPPVLTPPQAKPKPKPQPKPVAAAARAPGVETSGERPGVAGPKGRSTGKRMRASQSGEGKPAKKKKSKHADVGKRLRSKARKRRF
jgi:serine/threonine protein kinase